MSLRLSLRRILTAALSVTIAVSFILPPFSRGSVARAEEGQGTIIVDQGDTPYLGSWGLSMPTGVLDGESKVFTTQKPAGQYALTVTPPAGAVVRIDVFNNETLTKSFETRTATGELGSGQTLKFVIAYDFSLLGQISVTSIPTGLQVTLRGPRGTQDITTPFLNEHMPEGTYSATYLLPTGCKPAAPIVRRLTAGGRISFVYEAICPLLTGSATTPKPQPKPVPVPVPVPESSPTPPPPTKQGRSGIRVSLTTPSHEVAAGASARLSLRVLNTGDSDLKNLTVEYRFEPKRLTVQGVRHGEEHAGSVTWMIAALAPRAKWEESFAVRIVAGSATGDTPTSSTVTVTGEDLGSIPAAERSASVSIVAIKALPATGAPLEIIFLGAFLVGIASGIMMLRRMGSAQLEK